MANTGMAITRVNATRKSQIQNIDILVYLVEEKNKISIEIALICQNFILPLLGLWSTEGLLKINY